MRCPGWDPVRVAGGQDALLARDDHRQAALHDDAELLHLVLVRLDDRLGRQVVDDHRRVIGLHDTALEARRGLDERKVARTGIEKLWHQ